MEVSLKFLRYERFAGPHNKPWSIVGDSEFARAINAICKNMMREGKIGTVVHKNPITTEQMQELFASGQLGNADTNDPSQLLRTARFYLTLYFGKRGRDKQRKLTKEMLVLQTTPQGRTIL